MPAIVKRILQTLRNPFRARHDHIRPVEREPMFNAAVVELPIEQLRSWTGGSWKERMRNAGLDPFDKPIREIPHYDAMLRLDVPLECCTDSPYVRYMDERRGLRRNDGYLITSGIERLAYFRSLKQTIERTGHFDPIQVHARSDGTLSLLDGTHRSAIALALGMDTIPGIIVDVDGELRRRLREGSLDSTNFFKQKPNTYRMTFVSCSRVTK